MNAVKNPLEYIRSAPHWVVLIRPGEYVEEKIVTLTECWNAIAKAKVGLRGWDFPHVDYSENRQHGSNWVASWANFMGHVEYWRLYQSGQFVHFSATPETEERDWQEKLRNRARVWIGSQSNDVSQAYLSMINILWRITEIYEFSARLAQSRIYEDTVLIRIGLHNIKNFALSETDRAFHDIYKSDADSLEHDWILEVPDLVTDAPGHALKSAVWFFERFNWLNPPSGVLRDAQQELFQLGR